MKKILNLLKKYNTPVLSDALDSLNIDGGLINIKPQIESCNIVGIAFTVKYGIPTDYDKFIGKAADFIDDVNTNNIIILANNGRIDCTVWGGILTKMAKTKNIQGTIIDGMCRDIEDIIHYNYPVFSKGIYMQSGKSRTILTNIQVPVYIGKTAIHPGDFIRGDANGVIVIPQNIINEVLIRAEYIQKTEKCIISAIENNMPLKIARLKYKYHRPWEKNKFNE